MIDWVYVKGYETLYQINMNGQVRSLGRMHPRYGFWIARIKELRPAMGSHGYLSVGLSKNKKMVQCNIHRLLAEQFIPKREDLNCKTIVNHKDGNKLNNNLDNLEWVTYSENLVHAYRTGLNPGYKNSKIRYGRDPKVTPGFEIRQEIRKMYGLGARQASLATEFNIDQSTVSRMVNFQGSFANDKCN